MEFPSSQDFQRYSAFSTDHYEVDWEASKASSSAVEAVNDDPVAEDRSGVRKRSGSDSDSEDENGGDLVIASSDSDSEVDSDDHNENEDGDGDDNDGHEQVDELKHKAVSEEQTPIVQKVVDEPIKENNVKTLQLPLSKLSESEHAEYLTLLGKLKSNPLSLKSAEENRFKKLEKIVMVERQQYESTIREWAFYSLSERYIEPSKTLLQQFPQFNWMRFERIKNYQSLVPFKEISGFFQNLPNSVSIHLTLRKTLLKVGKIPKLKLPHPPNQIFPTPYTINPPLMKQRKIPALSCDSNVEPEKLEKLMQECQLMRNSVVFVFSSSSVVNLYSQLLQSDQLKKAENQSLLFPISISRGSNYIIVYFDKPVQRNSEKVGLRNSITRFFKHSLHEAFLSSNPEDNPIAFSSDDTLEEESSNLTYNLWKLGSVNLVVRCRIHGYTMVESGGEGKKVARMVHLASRFQYQRDILSGFEVPNQHEFSTCWLQTLLRPETLLYLGHVNMREGKKGVGQLDYVEVKSMPELYHLSNRRSQLSNGTSSDQQQQGFSRLHGLLGKLSIFASTTTMESSSKFLFSIVDCDSIHLYKDESIERTTEKHVVFDLSDIPYCPVDFVPSAPHHIPWTFNPIKDKKKNTKALPPPPPQKKRHYVT